KRVDLKKLAHLIVHQNCDGIKCHGEDGKVCPLFDTMCHDHCRFEAKDMKGEIKRAMEHHGIVRGDLVEPLIGLEYNE
ncbi:unnamed protein product, partial [marine sediment metagenome]